MRQVEVLQLISGGLVNREIGTRTLLPAKATHSVFRDVG